MARSQLRTGAEIELEGHRYRLIRQVDGGLWVLENLQSGRPLERHHDELLRDYVEGALTFKRQEIVGIDQKRRPAELSAVELSEAQLAEAERRRLYTKAVQGLPKTRSVYEPAIRQAWEALARPEEPLPFWNTVVRWVNSVEESDGSHIGLVSNYCARGNRSARVNPLVQDCVEWVIDSFYLTLERPSIQQAVDFAAGEVLNANKLLPRSQQLVPASRGFVSRLIAKLPEEDVVLARYGYEHARRKYRGNTKVRITEAPLERAEADHGRLDIFVIDSSSGAPLGRPWLSVLLDDNSRAVLGLTLNFATPSSSALAHLFRHSFLPKFEKDKYPALVHEWFAFGVPGELSFDNGMEFHANEVRQAAQELGIDLSWAARKQPWRKGKVERLIRSINRGLVALFGGKTFSNIFEKDDYDPTRHAIATLEELKAAIVKWVCDVYHQRKHSALGCSPAEKWAKGIKPSDIDMIPDIKRLDAVLGAREKRMLDHSGIEYAGLSYNCPELNDVRRKEGATVEVQIRIDKENLGSIIVLLPRTGEPMRVPCRDGSYAEGLSLWQHDLCKKYAKSQRKPGGTGNSVQDWRIAFAAICRASMQMLEERGGKRKKSQGLANARWVQLLDTMLLNADAASAEAARPKLLAVNRTVDEQSPIEALPEAYEPPDTTAATNYAEPAKRAPKPPRPSKPKADVEAPIAGRHASSVSETPSAEPEEPFVPKFTAIIKPQNNRVS